MASLIGVVLDGRYRLEARMSARGDPRFEAYSATELHLERAVLIELARLEAIDEARFRQEARAVSRLDHPGIARLLDLGVHEGRPYVVREILDARPLEQALGAAGKLGPEDSAAIIAQLADALDHAHQAGVLHRALAPHRVLISTAGRARISDFGVASIWSADVTAVLEAAPEYAAPEILAGQTHDARADLYSLGAIAYRMLSRRVPFAGANAAEVLERMAHEPYVALAEAARLEARHGRFAAVVDRMLMRDPEQRSSTAALVARALRVSAPAPAARVGEEGDTLLDVPQPPAAQVPITVPVAAPAIETLRELAAQGSDTLREVPRPQVPEPMAVSAPRPAAEKTQQVDRASRGKPETLPDGSDAVVLVADPNRTVEAAVDSLQRAPLAQVMDLSDEQPTPRGHAPIPSVFLDGQVDPRAVKSDLAVAFERVVERLRPAMERLEVERRTRWLRRGAADLLARGETAADRIPVRALSARQKLLAVAAVPVLILLLVALFSGGEQPAPIAPPGSAEIAAQCRKLTAEGKADKAIERLEEELVAANKYGDTVLHAALANAFVRSGESGKALQHFGVVIHQDASVLSDGDVRDLVSMLGLPAPDGDKAQEIVGALGERAKPMLRLAAENKAAEKTLRKRAKDLLQAGDTEAKAVPAKKK